MKNMKRAPAKARHPLTFSSSVGSRHKSNNGACVQCDLRQEREGAYANTMSVSGRNAFFEVYLFFFFVEQGNEFVIFFFFLVATNNCLGNLRRFVL